MNTRSRIQGTGNRWLNWRSSASIFRESAKTEPTKPSIPGSVGFVGAASGELGELGARLASEIDTKSQPFESVLKGQAVELWSDSRGRLFLVADAEDAAITMSRYGARRGEIYTDEEARRIVAVGDPKVVAEIHRWKRGFDGIVSDFRKERA